MGLSFEEQQLWDLLEESEGVEALLEFVPLMSPWLKAPQHLRPLADIFYRAETTGYIRALTSVPPQHGKTTSILHFIVHFLKKHPDKTVGYVSYASTFAESKSKECRDIAERAGLKIRDDFSSAREWRLEEGGGFLAAGVGGPLTGYRVDFLVIDDIVKNRETAESPTFQQIAIDWAKSTGFTRLSKDASVIVNMTRWTDGDLIGRLPTETETLWEKVNLPAISADGTALWEEVKPLEFLQAQKRLVGPYNWAALFEGNPQPRGGALFREPTYYRLANVAGARFAIACDPAATAKTSADYSAIVVVCAQGDGLDQVVDVVDAWRGQVEIPQLVAKLREVQLKWGCPIYVEAQGGFKAVPQLLRIVGGRSRGDDPRDPLRIVELPALGDKFTRALPVSAAWNDKRVRLPEPSPNAPWLKDFIDEVCKFTGKGDRKDDQVDALSHAFRAIDRRGIAIERGVRTPNYLSSVPNFPKF